MNPFDANSPNDPTTPSFDRASMLKMSGEDFGSIQPDTPIRSELGLTNRDIFQQEYIQVGAGGRNSALYFERRRTADAGGG